jgi:DNA-directed RNA polymerase specialized sigma subunit
VPRGRFSANPFAGIQLTISGIPRPKRKAPEARAALVAFAAEHAGREAELERAAEALRADRDKAIRQAYKDGLPMSGIADVLSISHQRVSQIVRS